MYNKILTVKKGAKKNFEPIWHFWLRPPKVKNLNSAQTGIQNHRIFINYLTKTMKITRFFIPVMLLFATKGVAQQNLQDSIATKRIKLHKTNMFILGAWAGANILQGSISAGNTKGSGHYFHQMNAWWNIANLGLAALGLRSAKKQSAKQYSLAGNIIEQHKIEKILLLNTGLDAAYIITGFYLKERGNRLNHDQPVGYGNSLLLQGSFLLVFDIIQYTKHRRNGKLLEQSMGNLQLGTTPNGIGLTYQIH